MNMKQIQLWNKLSPNWHKIRRGAAAMRNEEHFCRNERGFQYLEDLSIFQPTIVQFFEDEKKAIMAMINEEAKDELLKGYYPNTVKLGKWWLMLLDNPKVIYAECGPLNVVEDTLMDSDWSMSYSTSDTYQRDRHEVRVHEFPYRWIDQKPHSVVFDGEDK